jgi:hypothetical protein
MEQVYALLEAARQNASSDTAEAATAFRAAQAKDAAWKKYMDHLSARTKKAGNKSAAMAPAVISRAQLAELKKLSSRRAN